MLIESKPYGFGVRFTPLDPHLLKPQFGKIPEQRCFQRCTASLQPTDLQYFAALRKVGGIVEAPKGDFCSVSYTRLDVYKRQGFTGAGGLDDQGFAALLLEVLSLIHI